MGAASTTYEPNPTALREIAEGAKMVIGRKTIFPEWETSVGIRWDARGGPFPPTIYISVGYEMFGIELIPDEYVLQPNMAIDFIAMSWDLWKSGFRVS